MVAFLGLKAARKVGMIKREAAEVLSVSIAGAFDGKVPNEYLDGVERGLDDLDGYLLRHRADSGPQADRRGKPRPKKRRAREEPEEVRNAELISKQVSGRYEFASDEIEQTVERLNQAAAFFGMPFMGR